MFLKVLACRRKSKRTRPHHQHNEPQNNLRKLTKEKLEMPIYSRRNDKYCKQACILGADRRRKAVIRRTFAFCALVKMKPCLQLQMRRCSLKRLKCSRGVRRQNKRTSKINGLRDSAWLSRWCTRSNGGFGAGQSAHGLTRPFVMLILRCQHVRSIVPASGAMSRSEGA